MSTEIPPQTSPNVVIQIRNSKLLIFFEIYNVDAESSKNEKNYDKQKVSVDLKSTIK